MYMFKKDKSNEAFDFVKKTEFGIVDYVSVVETIAQGFIDNGEYIPHYGKLNAMAVFYNECIDHEKLNVGDYIVQALELEPLITNADFVNAFNQAISDPKDFRLDFANAYKDAMDIVENNKGSLQSIANKAVSLITKYIDEFTKTFDEDTVNTIASFAEEATGDKFTSDKIVNSYISLVSKAKNGIKKKNNGTITK